MLDFVHVTMIGVVSLVALMNGPFVMFDCHDVLDRIDVRDVP
jgi:hypothetical protein